MYPLDPPLNAPAYNEGLGAKLPVAVENL